MKPETRMIYAAARAVLTDREFEAWDLHYRAGWSYQQIATVAGVDRSTAQRRVRRAVEKVHDKLEEAA